MGRKITFKSGVIQMGDIYMLTSDVGSGRCGKKGEKYIVRDTFPDRIRISRADFSRYVEPHDWQRENFLENFKLLKEASRVSVAGAIEHKLFAPRIYKGKNDILHIKE